MDEYQRAQIYHELSLRDTEDLLDIWESRDTNADVHEIARQILTERLGHAPDKLLQAKIDRLLDEIGSRYRAGDFTGAIRLCTSALAEVPSLSTASLYLGLCYEGQGLMEQAIASYREVLRLDPGNKDARRYMETVERVLEDRFEKSDSRRRLDQAVEFAEDGDPENAVKEIALARQSMPEIASAYNYLGQVYEGLEKYRLAIDAYIKALRLTPQYPAARKNLAHARKMLEDEQFRQAAMEEEGEPGEEGKALPDFYETQDAVISKAGDVAPEWVYADEKAQVLSGWPGHRNRQRRSGLDYLDTEYEMYHTSGGLIRQVFTLNLRLHHTIDLIFPIFLGILCCLPLLFGAIELATGDTISAIKWILLSSPFWVSGWLLLANVVKSIQEGLDENTDEDEGQEEDEEDDEGGNSW